MLKISVVWNFQYSFFPVCFIHIFMTCLNHVFRFVSRIWIHVPFFANALFWVSGNNLCPKQPTNSCK